jgi:hypothetical protein
LVGKTVIPVRDNKHLLTHPDAVQRLLRLEAEAARDPASAGRASHLQIVARRAVTDAGVASDNSAGGGLDGDSTRPPEG